MPYFSWRRLYTQWYICWNYLQRILPIFTMSPSPLCLLVSEPDCRIVWWFCCSSDLIHQCDLMSNTGNSFRSSVLRVMSPARCPCAIPVKWCDVVWCCFTSLKLWRIVSLKRPNYRIPPVGFDPTTSKLWAWRSAPELRRWNVWFGAFMTQESFLKTTKDDNTGDRFRSCDLPLIRR